MTEAGNDIEMSGEEQEVATASTSSSSVRNQDFSIFGEPCLFKEEKLPTKMDVLRRVFLNYNERVEEKTKVQLKYFCGDVAKEIIDIWKKTTIPIIKHLSIKKKWSVLSVFIRIGTNLKRRLNFNDSSMI